MKTLKQVATLCLVATFVLAMVASSFGLHGAAYNSAGISISVHTSHVLLDEVPTPTPTIGAGTNSNPSGGGDGG